MLDNSVDGMVWSVASTFVAVGIRAQCACLTAAARNSVSTAPRFRLRVERSPIMQSVTEEDIMTAMRGNLSHASSVSDQEDGGHTSQTNGATLSSSTAELSEHSQSSTRELTRTWVHFAKTFVIIFPIYVLGYFEFSFSWLLIALTIFFFWRRNTRCKNTRLNRAFSFFEQKDTVKQELEATDLPSWVSNFWFIHYCVWKPCLSVDWMASMFGRHRNWVGVYLVRDCKSFHH